MTSFSLDPLQHHFPIYYNHFNESSLSKISALIHYFLGIEVQPTSDGLLLNQAKFTHEILVRAKMTEAQVVSTPCTMDKAFSVRHGEPLPDPVLYRSIVGALQYLTLTRPNIAYSVNTACQFLHAPITSHWQFVKRILRYPAETPLLGLYLTQSFYQLLCTPFLMLVGQVIVMTIDWLVVTVSLGVPENNAHSCSLKHRGQVQVPR
ncbi:hypothetical protein Patl1_15996 [Pistacia atlantica]|uniref:Uncharacterized protein n=1 Tax=Pistacia atlantica TaxID=434234 RepID=A0ACC1B7N8_9ROSI|nr:hypothetical protein Patl1_15996 [Pistacia atlantica]